MISEVYLSEQLIAPKKFSLLTFDMRVVKATSVFRSRRDYVALSAKASNQRSDFHIATPISGEGLPGCEGSGRGVREEASVSSGYACWSTWSQHSAHKSVRFGGQLTGV